MPLVSVIVPNYNHAKYLHQRIDSILNQSFQDFELILLDDCSTDNSREILSSYAIDPHVSHLVFNESNSGSPFAQWEKGIALAQGEWIWIAESDDWADEQFLEKMLSAANTNPTAGLLYSKALYVYPDGTTWTPSVSYQNVLHRGEDFVRQKLLFSNVIYNVSMTLFRRALYQQINASLYDHMRLCGDWFIYVLMCEQTDVLEVDQCLSSYRTHNIYPSYDAECAGLSFIEGFDVLSYIAQHYHIPAVRYSRHWGRMLVKYKKQYHYSKEIMDSILCRLISEYRLMYIYYRIYVAKKR